MEKNENIPDKIHLANGLEDFYRIGIQPGSGPVMFNLIRRRKMQDRRMLMM